MKKSQLIDYYILVPTIILTLFGIVMVYSASFYYAMTAFDNPHSMVIRQAIYAFLGFASLIFIVWFLPARHFKNISYVKFFAILSLILLVSVLIFGAEVNGAKGWFRFFGISFQPTELSKLVIIWYLAYILANRQKTIEDNWWQAVSYPIIYVLLTLFLIAMQPDMGSAIIILSISFIMVIASGIPLSVVAKSSLAIIGGGLGILALTYFFGEHLPFFPDYIYNRIQAFVNPFELAQDQGLQLVNSYYALNRGGFFGVGIGQSIQKTGYLPEAYTDFIMAIVGEELGLIRLLLVLAVYFFLVGRIYLLAIRSKDTFNQLVFIGIASMFLIQASINLGGMLGLMPITGVTFPFISFGGTSLVISLISIAIVLNLNMDEKRRQIQLERSQSS